MTESWNKPLLAKWEHAVGKLPPGFFLQIDGVGSVTFLSVRYNGPGFRDIIQGGGKTPGQSGTSAHIGSISVENEDRERVVRFVKRLVARQQK